MGLGPIQADGGTQEIYVRLAMTEEGQAQLEKFLIDRDETSLTVATGTLNFLRVIQSDPARRLPSTVGNAPVSE